jgi:S-adenosylmethionine hydrolase
MDAVPVITLTTDFGLVDAYVGTMKGVMLGIAPDARPVDITHQIAPQDVRQTAYVLYTVYRFFPPHTVHLVVVDPGVGSARRAIALRTPRGSFVGPDNGVFSYVMAEQPLIAAVELADARYRRVRVSQTFHGRDIFAPAAAHLAAGVPIDQFGPPVPDPVTLPLPHLQASPGVVEGEVLHIDHFGNVITSVGRLVWEAEKLTLKPAFRETGAQEVHFRADEASITTEGHEIQGVRRTYAQVEPGDTLALVGSTGHLEISVREGSGARKLGLQMGDPVELRW